MTQGLLWLQNQTMVPEVRFGLVTGDPAAGMFVTGNFPGASTTQLNNARNMYSLLTGRVSQILGNARLNEDTNQYQYLGNGFQRGTMRQWGFYVQDNWRVRNNLTINAGLRYELQQPFVSRNDSYSTATLADICGISGIGADGQCNLFKPGTLTGRAPFYVNYTAGHAGVQDRQEQLRAEPRADLPSRVPGRHPAQDVRRGRRLGPLRIVRASPTSAPAWRTSRASSATTRASRSR